MTQQKTKRGSLSLAIAMLGAGGLTAAAPAAFAEQAEPGGELEEVVVTGLRGRPRTATDSPVPVDVFNQDAITAVSQTDTHDVLQTLIPSYNVARQPISDGASFIRPATLRGLPSHHTLVLVNGKRRHRAALVGIGGSGTQGPDVATIPSSAIGSIEVLRDGASSQYGSDAIAGVINFNLRENRDGFSLSYDVGEYSEGDGMQNTVTGNLGLPLGDNGFLSISGEYYDQEATYRGAQYCESWFCVDPDNPRFDEEAGYANYVLGQPDPSAPAWEQAAQAAFPAGIPNASVEGPVVQPWGQPNTDRTALFYNAGIDVSDAIEVYSYGNYTESNGDGSFFYRYPGNGTIEPLRRPDGSVYTPLELFPGGFTPRFEGAVTDYSFIGGARGSAGGFNWDLSGRYGFNEIDYTLFNTINPSLGPESPTSFQPGALSNEEVQFQADFSYELDTGTYTPTLLAFGLSYLDETYDVQQSSDVASYEAGPYATPDPHDLCTDEADFALRTAQGAGVGVAGLDCTNAGDPVYTVVGVGSNGFPGYSPAFSDVYERDSYAAYVDVSADLTEQLFLQTAARYEDYSDFGNELVWKVAGRYRLTDAFALRGSVGTGFRAPTPGQQGTTNVSTRLPNGFPVATGLFPASGPVAQALGAQPLDAETSTNYTLGFTANTGALTLTVDYYRIDIDDRFNSISTLDVSNDPTAGDAYDNFLALSGAGVAGAETIGGVFYFTNAFDTKTTGVDVVATYGFEWGAAGSTDLTWAMNWNQEEITSDASEFLNEEGIYDFENLQPNTRNVVTAVHSVDRLTITGRGRYFGESSNSDASGGEIVDLPNGTPAIEDYGAIWLFDLEAAYQINQNFRVTVGGRNLFDTFPDEADRNQNDNDQCCGRIYNSGTIVPWMGQYFFARLSADF